MIDAESIVITVPLILVTLVLGENSVPASVVTTSPTLKSALLLTVMDVAPIPSDATVLVSCRYLKSL